MNAIRILLIIAVLGGAFAILRSIMSKSEKRDKGFNSPSFSKIRKERQEVDRGDLVKDALTGTYISKENAVKRTIEGETYWFADEENARQFLEKGKS